MKRYYVLEYENGDYVGLDKDSGGYPYCTDLKEAKFWLAQNDALMYMKMFPEEKWNLFQVELVKRRWVAGQFGNAKNKCVHTEHCCIYHGCKYADDDCPVANKTEQQSYPCESCCDYEPMPD